MSLSEKTAEKRSFCCVLREGRQRRARAGEGGADERAPRKRGTTWRGPPDVSAGLGCPIHASIGGTGRLANQPVFLRIIRRSAIRPMEAQAMAETAGRRHRRRGGLRAAPRRTSSSAGSRPARGCASRRMRDSLRGRRRHAPRDPEPAGGRGAGASPEGQRGFEAPPVTAARAARARRAAAAARAPRAGAVLRGRRRRVGGARGRRPPQARGGRGADDRRPAATRRRPGSATTASSTRR